MGIWNKESRLELLVKEKFEIRKNMTGVLIRAVTEYNPPFTTIDEVKENNLPPGYQANHELSKLYQINVIFISFSG